MSRFAVILTLLVLPAMARAELLASDDFDYTPGSIHGAGGGSGWDGGWLGQGGSVEAVVDTSASPLSYRAGAGEGVHGGEAALAFSGNNDFAAHRDIDTSRRHRDVYVSMLVRFEGTQNANDFLALWFEEAGFGAAPNIGVKMNDGTGAGPDDFFARTQANNHVSHVDLVAGQTYFLVGHLSKPNNGRNTPYDEFRLWVNPATLSAQPTPDGVSRGDSNITGFFRVGFRSVNLDADDRIVVDRLRIGTHWEDVAGPDVMPVLALNMDEDRWTGAAGEVMDAASGLHGTAHGGAGTANVTPAIAADPGTCRYGVFDGSRAHVLVPHDPALNGTDALTYTAWVRPRRWNGVRQVMAKSVHGGGSGRAQMGIFSEGNVLKARVETLAGRREVAAALPALDQWSHLAAVFDGQRLELYVNAVLVASRNFGPTTLVQTTDVLAVGKRVGTAAYFFDGLIDEVRVYTQALSGDAVADVMGARRPCATVPITAAAAFAIGHDGHGIHCLDETIEVSALDSSGSVLPGYDRGVQLDTGTGRGSWQLVSGAGAFVDAVADDGVAVYVFSPADAGTAVFALSYREGSAPLDVDVWQQDDVTIRDGDGEGPLMFAPSGFTITASALANPPEVPVNDPLTPQTAGADFPLHIAAYGVTPDDPVCGVIESYAGPRSVSFTMTHVNPEAGPMTAEVNGQPAGRGSQTVTFVQGQAEVGVRYADVGRVRLGVRDAASFPHVLEGSSDPFVVRPAELVVSRVTRADGTDNPAGAAPEGAPFVAAGEAFVVEVEARSAEGHITPSFGRESPAEEVRIASDALVMPAGGRNGSGGDVTNPAAFSATATPGRFRNQSVLFDEVGSIVLRPALADGDYLGTGVVPGRQSGPVGRFYPAAFDVVGDSVTAACGSFSYMDQPALSVAFRLQALNSQGAVTENYDAGLLAGHVAHVALTAEAADDGVDRGARLPALTETWGGGEVVVNRGDVAFARLSAPDGPFEALQLGLRVLDPLDGVALLGADMAPDTSGDCAAAGTCTARALSGPTRMVYGRLAVLPAAGPEQEALAVPLAAQIFTGAAFERHPADACSLYAAGDAGLSDFQGELDAGETAVVGPAVPAMLVGGSADPAAPLMLSAPGSGNAGSARLRLDVPAWLEFDWQGSGDEDPAALVQFGRYRGHDRIIYRGEPR